MKTRSAQTPDTKFLPKLKGFTIPGSAGWR